MKNIKSLKLFSILINKKTSRIDIAEYTEWEENGNKN